MNIIQIKEKIISSLKQIISLYRQMIAQIKKQNPQHIETVEEIIRRVALSQNVDPELAVDVARCESSLNPLAQNKNPSGSLDRGIYQWNTYWHPEVTDQQAYDPEMATLLFCQAVKRQRLYWWSASRKCWDKYSN